MVLNAGDLQNEDHEEAMTRLCEIYWRPVYCYARQRGNSEDDAKDLTQEFFRHLLENEVVRKADPARGKFRSFLLGSMKNFLTNEWRKATAMKRGGGVMTLPMESDSGESLYLTSLADLDTPESIYDKSWALATLEEAMVRLEEEYETRGKGDLFRKLRLLLWGDRSTTYSELGNQLGMSEAAVKMAVARLRERAREQLRSEVAHCVALETEIDEEYSYLRELLQRS